MSSNVFEAGSILWMRILMHPENRDTTLTVLRSTNTAPMTPLQAGSPSQTQLASSKVLRSDHLVKHFASQVKGFCCLLACSAHQSQPIVLPNKIAARGTFLLTLLISKSLVYLNTIIEGSLPACDLLFK